MQKMASYDYRAASLRFVSKRIGTLTDNARDPFDIYVLSAETNDYRTIALRFFV